MNYQLRESKNHGTPQYPYSHYTISNIHHSFRVPIHWHDELEVIYVRTGKLWVNVGGTVYDLNGGQVVIVNPRQLHLMGSEDRTVCYHTLLFPLELISFQSMDELEQTVFLPLRTGKRRLTTKVPEAALTPENLALLDSVGLDEDEANRRVLKLSGGQQQRVAIARALSYDPDIILADEPTGNLDRDTQKEIMEIFRELADQGKCVILVSHSMEVASMCDERYELTKIQGKSKRTTRPQQA